jgi:hypothetical protein
MMATTRLEIMGMTLLKGFYSRRMIRRTTSPKRMTTAKAVRARPNTTERSAQGIRVFVPHVEAGSG